MLFVVLKLNLKRVNHAMEPEHSTELPTNQVIAKNAKEQGLLVGKESCYDTD